MAKFEVEERYGRMVVLDENSEHVSVATACEAFLAAEVRRLQVALRDIMTLFAEAQADGRDSETQLDRERQRAKKAEADTKRLDWMSADIFDRKVYIRDYDENTGKRTFICKCKTADTVRAALDAAMASELAQLRNK